MAVSISSRSCSSKGSSRAARYWATRRENSRSAMNAWISSSVVASTSATSAGVSPAARRRASRQRRAPGSETGEREG